MLSFVKIDLKDSSIDYSNVDRFLVGIYESFCVPPFSDLNGTNMNQPIISGNKSIVGLTFSLPILDTLQKINSLLVNVDIPIDTKRLKD